MCSGISSGSDGRDLLPTHFKDPPPLHLRGIEDSTLMYLLVICQLPLSQVLCFLTGISPAASGANSPCFHSLEDRTLLLCLL